MTSVTCSVESCESQVFRKTMCQLHYHRDYAAKNRERLSEYKRTWYQDNVEVEREKRKVNYQNNKEAYKARASTWSAANPERRGEIRRASDRRHPEIKEKASLKRRATKRNAFVESFTADQLLDMYGSDCHICLKPIDLDAPRRIGYEGWEAGLHIDHVVPLSRGGEHSLKNARPAHGLCNLRKGSTQPDLHGID